MDQAARRSASRFLRVIARHLVPAAVLASVAFGGLAAPAAADPAAQSTPAPSDAALASPASPATTGFTEQASDGAVTVFLAPGSGGTLAPGQDLDLELVVVNRTGDASPAGTAVFSLATGTIDSRAALDAWMSQPATGADDDLGTQLASADVPEVAAGTSTTVYVTVPAGSLPLGADAEFGPRGVAARYLHSGSEQGQARASIVYAATPDALPTPLSIIVPIVPPESTAAVLSEETLEALTAPTGRLTRLLDAVDGTAAVLAIDPRIVFSIRALGDAAPPSAERWLERLTELPNDSFALPYADADEGLMMQAGATTPPALSDIGFALDPSRTTPTASPTSTASTTATDETPSTTPSGGGDGESGSPDPSATAGDDDETPDYEELAAFPYTIENVAWPAAATLAPGQASVLADWGAKHLVLDASNIELYADANATPPAATLVDGWSALVADTRLSSAVADAAASDTDAEWNAATSLASSILAVVARELPYEPRHLLATVGRSALDDPGRLGALLRTLDGNAWSDLETASFPSTEEADGTLTATLVGGGHDQAAVDRTAALFASEQRAIGYSSIFDDPERFTGELRGTLLSTLSTGYVTRAEPWASACTLFTDLVDATEASVHVADTSDIQLVGRQTDLPIFVTNDTEERVTVQVDLRPVTGRIEAGEPVTLVIEPNSMARAQVPVTAITNGATSADVVLLTPEGTELTGPAATLNINVQAEWEAVGMIVFSVGLVLLFVAGVVRTVRKRRRERVGASTGPDEVGTTEE
ncbi:hypothetical protein F8O01_12305 [Pseudoclavibacter chungangensis]|uniref:2-oxoglutarate dehydrogenase n=1 Tax=Pseudoclavibacter chungangensis TaxID=587635 RepID=A0A7J5BPW6_9MICO|nr:DUF6049 family protein [Pseudoclavibacter chungangensis]KAB1655396.1 hypothetical protein F8O01_12305 [Pseudoclavibacter chungangensis]NYJ68353.1 hypothetical protein [Pseudoclavibacter chungangensis]